MQEIDEIAGLGKNTYSRIISGKQSIKLDELISIGHNVYNLTALKLLNTNLTPPRLTDLPLIVKKANQSRKGKTVRKQQRRDLILFCILILNKYFKVGSKFTNSEIKSYLTEELQNTFKDKSIEWNKSIVSSFIVDSNEKRKGKTKPEKLYILNSPLPQDIIERAITIVGIDWLK
ncbi:hypothetical protein ORI89_00360 [Sphingobacterium sp. UT-1RO-CII-1]|nr:hypothetical protein [Sphingobacterium sp. UT-1RO-CII-1]